MMQFCSGLQQTGSAAQQASCWPPSSGCLLVLPAEDLLLAGMQEAGGAVQPSQPIAVATTTL